MNRVAVVGLVLAAALAASLLLHEGGQRVGRATAGRAATGGPGGDLARSPDDPLEERILEEKVAPEDEAGAADFRGRHALHGRTVDESGRRVPFAEVRLFRLDRGAPREIPTEAAIRTTSDAEGRYRLPGLRAGRYRIAGFADGFARRPVARDVQLGDPETRKEVVLWHEQGILLHLVLPDGCDASEAEWTISPAGRTDEPERDAGGRWFWPTAAGEFQVRVRVPRWVSSAQTVAVEGGRVSSAEIRVGRGFEVEGTVVDEEDRPVAGAFVAATPPSAGLSDGRGAPTDAFGRFRISGLGEGPCELKCSLLRGEEWISASARCVAPATGVSLRLAPRSRLRFSLDPAAGDEEIQALVLDAEGAVVRGLWLEPAEGARELPLPLEGRFSLLLDAGNAFAGPVPFEIGPGRNVDLGRLPLSEGKEARVTVSGTDGRPIEEADLIGWGLTHRGAEPVEGAPGEHRFDRLPEGPVAIRARARGYSQKTVLLRDGDRTARVVLEREGMLVVRVTDVAGEAIPAAEVAVRAFAPGSASSTGRSFLDGEVRFSLAPGDYSVEARGELGRPKSVRAALAEGETREVEIVLGPP